MVYSNVPDTQHFVIFENEKLMALQYLMGEYLDAESTAHTVFDMKAFGYKTTVYTILLATMELTL